MPHRNPVVTARKSESPPPPQPSPAPAARSIFAGEESGKKLVSSDELLLSHFRHCCALNGLSGGSENNSLARNGSNTTATAITVSQNSQNLHQQDHVVSDGKEEENGHLRKSNGESVMNGGRSGKKNLIADSSCPPVVEVPSEQVKSSDCAKLIQQLVEHDLNKDFSYVDHHGQDMERPKKIYKIVLTGGPCGGKTTGQARLCTFFENLGWKVFRVPEAATVLLGGGIKFGELTEEQALLFQEHLLRTMMQIETVFFKMAETVNRDVLIICDRGAMDASAFIQRSKWEGILNRNGWNEVELRDTRYNHILHMVSAANGAEPFYTIEDHTCRSESIDLARELDRKAAQAWVGHPYFDVVDNSSDFETKLCRMIHCVCQKLGIDTRDRLQTNSKKVKYLVSGPLPEAGAFPPGFQDFAVVHDYLQTSSPKTQARLRKRGQKGNWSYTYTVRRPELQGQIVEVKTALTQRDYNNMLAQRDHDHVTVYKKRRCFLINDQYFQLDVYEDPCHPRCKGMLLLETYSTLSGTELEQRLPKFLNIQTEVTGDPRYSMFNLSLKERWLNNKKFCQSLGGSEDSDAEVSKNEARLAVWENAK